MTDPTDLPGLVAKWRAEADDAERYSLEADSVGLYESAKTDDRRAKLLNACASELEAALRAAPGAVAWMYHWDNGGWRLTDDKSDAALAEKQGAHVVALFTHPAPAAVEGENGRASDVSAFGPVDGMCASHPEGSYVMLHVSNGNQRQCIRISKGAAEVLAAELIALATPAPATRGEWVMVPREPTEEMLRAGLGGLLVPESWRRIYAAMLAAAPKQGSVGVGGNVLHGHVRTDEEVEAACFRWLTEDIADREERERRNELLRQMPTMSYAAVCAQINHEWTLVADKARRELTQAALGQAGGST